jgi:8-oxo-dGTP pyrophosphatase MutT (NUDIX family)
MVTRMATAGLLVIEDRKLLLAYSVNKNCFYLPGGKVDGNETAAIALCREIAEEMNVTIDAHELKYYTHITAPAYGEQNGTIMEQDCFFLHRNISPQASAEIGELKFFSLDDYLLESNRAPGAVMILEKLKNGGYID